MKNKLVLGLIIAIMISTTPAAALAWGSATHLYLAEKLGNKDGTTDQQEMYGATLIDVFNLMFGYDYQPYLWYQTHYEFMKLADAAEPDENALAYGFVSHNEAWGADYTAHIDALTIEGNEGYVIIKSAELASVLKDAYVIPALEYILTILGYDLSDPDIQDLIDYAAPIVSLMLADSGVESAIDYLVSQNEDKKVGFRMYNSAQKRGDFVPNLLCQAYAGGLASEAGISIETASGIIYATELAFRAELMNYGNTLTQNNVLESMAEQGAELAIDILQEEYGIEIPPELYNVAKYVATGLMTITLSEAIEVVKEDYAEELEATQKYVKKQLNAHKIKTYRRDD
ncbi:hypothetical protein ACFL0Q_04950 [Thermodesulfobacteriota bacterium]